MAINVADQECYEKDNVTYVIEVPVRDHKKPEIVEAKKKEIENLRKYNVFEEVDDIGQETVGTRWVITQKEKQYGQKTKFKGRLVAKGFQEKSPPQSDSPTAHTDSLKLFLAIADGCGVVLAHF